MFQQTVAEIESGSVFFEMAISNTPKAALRRLEANTTLLAAKNDLVSNPEDACLYLENARQAFDCEVPDGYASPEDGALAAYISLLANVTEEGVQKFINEVAASGRGDLQKAIYTAQYYVKRVPSLTLCKAEANDGSQFTYLMQMDWSSSVPDMVGAQASNTKFCTRSMIEDNPYYRTTLSGG